ncbi:MAG: DUF5115 domain-containing protein [Mediterranea sp.]|jgi:hypothetical protein|nr:DUF5115 domain-containing protein [Mediterranea sp.]
MKKQFKYMGMLLMAAAFSACEGNYRDWADPQANVPETAGGGGALEASYAPGADMPLVMNETSWNTDSTELVKITLPSATEGNVPKVNSLLINGEHAIPCTVSEDGSVMVSNSDLDKVLMEIYGSHAATARDITVSLTAAAVTPDGEAFSLPNGEVSTTVTPYAPAVDADGYFMVGDYNGWGAEGALQFIPDASDPTLFTLETEFATAGSNFKVFSLTALTGGDGGSINWAAALGAPVDPDPSGDNFLVWTGAGAIQYSGVGKVKITLDLTNYRFKVENNGIPKLFMTGSDHNSWGTWEQLTIVNGTGTTGTNYGQFWGIFYCSALSEMKFAPQAGWDGGDFGWTDATSQASIDLAGLSNNGGNLKIGTAGWYIIHVTSAESGNTVEFYAPTVYLTGDCAVGGWTTQFGTGTEFAVPTEATGDFVSPAFVGAGDIRMCVVLPGIDWWKTEFIVLDGQIAYRGDGGDQARVQGSAGQTISLNFGTGTGSVQ